MKLQEFSDQFDVLYNNITSNQAPGLDEYEKSVFLTKAEKEIVKNYFSAGSMGNTLKQGYDDSAKRQADFSVLMKTNKCSLLRAPGSSEYSTYNFVTGSGVVSVDSVTFTNTDTHATASLPDGTYSCRYLGTALQTYYDGNVYTITGTGVPSVNCTLLISTSLDDRIDPRSGVWSFPEDVFIVINEALYTSGSKILQVIPLRYDEYTRLMSKPFKYPVKNQAWRLINTGVVTEGVASSKHVEIITNSWDTPDQYNIRYIRSPKPIIVAPLGDLSIDGESDATDCELDPILHEEILQRAVELAKIAWTATGQENVQLVVEAGKRSE